MPLHIRNGRIVTSTDSYVADIYCQDEQITQIGRDMNLPAGTDIETIDATGKYVFPGFIDPPIRGGATHLEFPQVS